MTRVDSPPDAEPLRLRVMGVTVEVKVADEETRDHVAHHWSRAVLPDDAEPGRLFTGPAVEPVDPEMQNSRDYMFASRVTLTGLRATAGERLNLHAGGLADDAGRVLAIVGSSGTGKTTATRALAGRLHYLSDETVSITPDLVVYPHPKPLSVIIDPATPTHKEQLSPDDLGLLSTPESGVLSRLVLLHRGVPNPRGLQPLDHVTALMELIEQSSSLGQLATPLPTLLDIVCRCGGALILEYDEIADRVDDLVHLLDADPVPATPPPTVHHPGPARTADRDPAGPDPADPDELDDDPRIRRLHWTDALEIEGDLLVLLQERALRLSDLTATLWLHLHEPRSLEDLVAWAQEVHGAHPDAATIVEQAVSALVEESLASRGSLA